VKENTEFHKIGTLDEIMEAFNECVKQLEEKDKEIKRLKEDYMILQNASDEVEEEKDKEIERLNNIINELEKDIKIYN